MRRLVANRLIHGVIVVWIVATITFILIHCAPGDPFGSIDFQMSAAAREKLLHHYGYDRPLAEQYGRYLWNLLHGDLGWSVARQEPVTPALLRALANTLLLMGVGLAATFILGIGIAIVQARRPKSLADRTLSFVSLVLYSTPEFWLAIMLVLALAYWVPIFPVSGMVSPALYDYLGPAGRFTDRMWHLALPALTITLVATGGIARYQRAELLEVLPLDYVRTARAKGVSEWRILTRHALRNALIPTITLFGLSFSSLFGGATLIEQVFSWPGMGLLVVDAIGNRDYSLLTGGVIVGSVAVVLGNLLADILLARLAPHAELDA